MINSMEYRKYGTANGKLDGLLYEDGTVLAYIVRVVDGAIVRVLWQYYDVVLMTELVDTLLVG